MSQADQAQSNPAELEDSSSQQRPPRSLAEWISFGVASLILAGVVGLVIYIWTGKEYQQPPAMSLTSDPQIREVGGYFYVPFKITNSGGGTAESVQIIAELVINGEVEESGEQQIDFLSGGETEEGAFVFTRDPQAGELNLRVGSYKLP